MSDEELEGWRDGWQPVVRRREAHRDLLIALSSKPMVTLRRLAWTDASARETLAVPEHVTVEVAPIPFSRLGRVWLDGVQMPADIELAGNFRDLTPQDLPA